MLFAISVFICIFYIFVDLVPVYKKRQLLLFWVYTLMMTLVLVLTMLISSGARIPSPAVPLERMVSKIFGY